MFKTPAASVKRKRESSGATPAVKKAKENQDDSHVERVMRSARRSKARMDNREPAAKKSFVQLSPIEMTSILQSARKTSKKIATEDIAPPSAKRVKMESPQKELNVDTTPKMVKAEKQVSPKRLSDATESNLNQSCHVVEEEHTGSGEPSFLNETFNTDSRSSRCTIL